MPLQHHRMCSPPRIPVYGTSQNTQPRFVGWQFQSPTAAPAPCQRYIAEPSTLAPKRRVSISPPRIVGVLTPPPNILGVAGNQIPAWQRSGASVRVPSPVTEGVRTEPRLGTGPAMPRRASSPCAAPPSRSESQIYSAREARPSRAPNPSICLAAPPCPSPRYRASLPDQLRGRATVPMYRASPCQFSPRRPADAVRSPSPLRLDHVAPARALSPQQSSRAMSPPVMRMPVTYHRASVLVPAMDARTRTPSPCFPASVRSGSTMLPGPGLVVAHPASDACRHRRYAFFVLMQRGCLV